MAEVDRKVREHCGLIEAEDAGESEKGTENTATEE